MDGLSVCSQLLVWQMGRCRKVDGLSVFSQLLVGACLDWLAPIMVRNLLSLMDRSAPGMSGNGMTQGGL